MKKNVMAASLSLKQFRNKIIKSKKAYDRKNKPVGREGDARLS